MPIINLNGLSRKNARYIHGDVFSHGPAADQHPSIGFMGRTYNSPFTESSKPPLATQFNVATQQQLPALQVQEAGQVVLTKNFIKVQPHEKGSPIVYDPTRHTIARSTGGPSQSHNTPTTPNSRKTIKVMPRPMRHPVGSPEKYHVPAGSFLMGAHSALTSHAPSDSMTTSRWNKVKKGAAG